MQSLVSRPVGDEHDYWNGQVLEVLLVLDTLITSDKRGKTIVSRQNLTFERPVYLSAEPCRFQSVEGGYFLMASVRIRQARASFEVPEITL